MGGTGIGPDTDLMPQAAEQHNYRNRKEIMEALSKVKFDEKGLVSAIAQDAATGEVLMLAYMNRDTLAETLEKGVMIYFSRSRQKRWFKGETSGHVQKVKEVFIDCDGDALLFKVDQTGAACHENYYSCFFRKHADDGWDIIGTKLDV
jgi:phosphoribosyl-AMP cyclohydrolase